MELNRLNGIRRQMAELALEGMSIPDIMQAVATTEDWDSWIAEARERTYSIVACAYCHHNTTFDLWRQNSQGVMCESCLIKEKQEAEKRANTPKPCKICEGAHLDRELIEAIIPTNTAIHTHTIKVCPTETELALDPYKVSCPYCDRRYLPFSSRKLCDTCWSDPLIGSQVELLHNQNKRALEVDLPATLTIKQWVGTLNYFGWKCAYCPGLYETLEHFLPLSIQGGTTADNCVPACNCCNVRKRNKHPNQFVSLFPSENIAKIQAYFSSLAMEVGA